MNATWDNAAPAREASADQVTSVLSRGQARQRLTARDMVEVERFTAIAAFYVLGGVPLLTAWSRANEWLAEHGEELPDGVVVAPTRDFQLPSGETSKEATEDADDPCEENGEGTVPRDTASPGRGRRLAASAPRPPGQAPRLRVVPASPAHGASILVEKGEVMPRSSPTEVAIRTTLSRGPASTAELVAAHGAHCGNIITRLKKTGAIEGPRGGPWSLVGGCDAKPANAPAEPPSRRAAAPKARKSPPPAAGSWLDGLRAERDRLAGKVARIDALLLEFVGE